MELKKTIQGAQKLSLGISIIVAVLLGIGIGIWMKDTFKIDWLFWLGVAWGIGAAILNIKIEYDKLKKSFEELEKDPRYKNYKIKKD